MNRRQLLTGAAVLTTTAAWGTPDTPPADIALFRDATETLFAIADLRRADNPAAPAVPRRTFVRDADEAHRLALEGPAPLVGMSLDDLLDCARSQHPAAGELVAVAGVHRGFLDLMAAGGIARIADLKGRRIAVDTDTGYASALFEMLRREGLTRGRDYEVVYAGATNLRYEKLRAGAFDATLLGAPFTRLAKRAGFVSLGSVIGALGGYQAIVLVARRSWLTANGAAAQATVACLLRTLAFARDPAQAPTVAAYVGRSLGLDASAASAVTDDLFGLRSEFLPDGRMRDADVAVVLDLFNASRASNLAMTDVRALFDARYLPLLTGTDNRNRPAPGGRLAGGHDRRALSPDRISL
ncbi:ABC transporter substrate-binding protein [Aquabacter spiritensis]|uniref:ABC-type nitrate/sulfonate/bicarbonate transport system substrate-binding protein n=1 Tax=Aquabacter spiritensis TaxID=933073 RepID=A0A4R3LL73_9HYPH|nr:ABC transporter substrate-binding protein [Aquabacter spiritensis]TCT01080.1 ABC-type nitrate/sulfonate/bicarbonate transport system substrate-binding protein [Aquabacter spiritensis]